MRGREGRAGERKGREGDREAKRGMHRRLKYRRWRGRRQREVFEGR